MLSTESKLGGYAVSTGRSRPWLNPASKKKKSEPEVVHPIFDQASKIVTDPYWVGIFSSAAIGKLPRGYMYRANVLTYKRGTKIRRVDIPDNAIEAISLCQDFFMKTTGMSSNQEQKHIQELQENQYTPSIYNLSWKEINSAEIKNLLIGDYIRFLAMEYQLTREEKAQLEMVINSGMAFGYFPEKSIDFSNGVINSIAGLLFDSDRRVFTIDPKIRVKVTKSSSRTSHVDRTSCLAHWNKFVKKCDDKYSTICGDKAESNSELKVPDDDE